MRSTIQAPAGLHAHHAVAGLAVPMALLLFAAAPATAQELVPNGGFEEVLQCPDDQSQLDRTAFWTSPNILGTPDYYHACGTDPLYSTPETIVGVQAPAEGEAYVGIFLRIDQSVLAEWREYIQSPLVTPLEPGRCYRFRMQANLAEYALLSTSSLGVRFNVGPYQLPDPFVPGDPPHLALPAGTFLDHDAWVALEGEYVAQGGETHLMIGNYAPDAATPTQAVTSTLPNAGPYVYVLIDAVGLEPCGLPTGVDAPFPGQGMGYTLHGASITFTDARWAGGTCRLFDALGRTVLQRDQLAGTVQWPAHLAGVHVLELHGPTGLRHRRTLLLMGDRP